MNLDDSLVDDLRCTTNQNNTTKNKPKKKVTVRASHLQDSLIIDCDNMNRSASGIKVKRSTSGIDLNEMDHFNSNKERFQTLLEEEIQIRNRIQKSPSRRREGWIV